MSSYTIGLEDIELLRMLLDEWKASQEGLEKRILQLEVCPDDLELANDICNRIHSIKRGSSFAGVVFLTKLCHEIETVLDAIRKKNIEVDADLIDHVLTSVDLLSNHISRLIQKVHEYDSSNEGAELVIDFNEEKRIDEIVRKINTLFEKHKQKKTQLMKRLDEDEATKIEILQSQEFARKLSKDVKEQFLFETYEHIDRIENQCLIKLDKEENNRNAINELFRAVHSIKGGTGLFIATEPKESPDFAVVKDFSNVVHSFENLLELIRDREIHFDENISSLCYETVDYLKASLESVALENGGSIPNAEILGKISHCISYIKSLPDRKIGLDSQPESGKQDQSQNQMQKAALTQSMQSIRVSQDKLDKMMNMISELLIAKNAFMHIASKLNAEYELPEISKEVKGVGFSISRISDELQNAIMSMRMVEVKTVFQKMPRIIRDISQSTGKKMELMMEGESTEIDKTIVEQISDPIVHLIRNAADHGIENPEGRRRKGKSETGKIVLRAYHKNKHVYIEIEDDGKGMDVQVLKKKAIDKGFITMEDAEKMTKGQLTNLIFLPGFSTASQITEVSGRGVGMDIVKSNIEKINGNIMIESEVDKGTKMVIQLPLTLAVSRGLTVNVSNETYIIPIDYISETVKINTSDIHKYNEKYFVHLRGNVIGIEWLSKLLLLGERNMNHEELNTVIISNGSEKFGIIVDKLKNEQEFVMKTLDGHLAGILGISGSTLLGNGQVVLIVNPVDIIQMAKK
ncbi:chemotaxis protein CheW [Aneurinibacillus terranovensis]|uniref:chemotaxis protein CheW n=1 Tax=Aneurinibacillus terranovensis TaxID=278991 RepID=UPI0003FCC682|nr:chemotaxis protein CheA [Aneurinibacillus terranovensis]